MSRSDRVPLLFWAVPALCVLAGVAYLIVLSIGGHPAAGVAAMILMVAFGGSLVIASRYSETVRYLLIRRDERISGIDIRATALAGSALTLAVIVGALVEVAHGRSGAPYTWLAAIAGVTYLASVIAQRIRQ